MWEFWSFWDSYQFRVQQCLIAMQRNHDVLISTTHGCPLLLQASDIDEFYLQDTISIRINEFQGRGNYFKMTETNKAEIFKMGSKSNIAIIMKSQLI